MMRLIIYVLISLALTLGITWLLGVPGTIQIDLAGYRLQPRIGISAIALIGVIFISVFIWTLVQRIFATPGFLQTRASKRRQTHGIDALSGAIIALQAGDTQLARQLARDARNKLPHNAAAQLLEARADLALGKWGEAREQYRALLDNPETALAALAGLYEQAGAQNRGEAALTFARKAHTLSPELAWAHKAIFDDLTDQKNWDEALKMVHGEINSTRADKQNRKRRLAVLHTAIAADDETGNPSNALDNARIALKLEPDFVPAALIAARIHSNKGEVRKATSLLKRVWRASRHPHIATLYANAQPGISPVERLRRLNDLIPNPPPDESSAIVLARIAIQAKQYGEGRAALHDFIKDTPSQSICVAMAEIEEGEKSDHGRARQWLARAVSAPRDPLWVADGVTAGEWGPVSPVSGSLDAFEFKIPTSTLFLEQDELQNPDPQILENLEIEESGDKPEDENSAGQSIPPQMNTTNDKET